ncbi:hypothetical protein NX059_000425 [Plenodomus lindquistii]|nr:hypothetical protein NX059_000425 [Plenodomus lindquistii]
MEAMRARIIELEEKLSRSGSNSAGPSVIVPTHASPSSTLLVETVTSSAGRIDVLQDIHPSGGSHGIARGIAHKNRVFGQSHWMTNFVIFQDVLERAKVLGRQIKIQRSPTWPAVSNKELPPKDICDRLVDGYLRSIERVYRILHVPSFRREYEASWELHTEVSMPFVIQLKLVLAIGAILYDEGFSKRPDATRWIYEAQTWLSSPVFKSQLGIRYIQTSILLLLARDFVDVGSELVWISAGSVVRAAVYIGLHRDPTRLPSMDKLEAEMRRRVWNTILELSLQMSLESGGPCYISLQDFDSEPPANYDDEQLEDPTSVPKANEVLSDSSVALALRQTFAARLAVVKLLNDATSIGTYSDTLRVDTDLRAAYKTSRSRLQGYKSTGSLAESTLQFVDFAMQAYISALHLPFFRNALNDPLYAYSRHAVVNTSLRIWALAVPQVDLAPYSMGTNMHGNDLACFCRCGSGFFRTLAFHATTFIGIDARVRLEDGGDSTTLLPQVNRILDDASDWYLKVMKAGETGLKGFLLLRLLAAHLAAADQNVVKTEIPLLLAEAARKATETCLPILEAMADPKPEQSVTDGVDPFDFQLSSGLFEDWDVMMSDVFNFGPSGASFDSLLT